VTTVQVERTALVHDRLKCSRVVVVVAVAWNALPLFTSAKKNKIYQSINQSINQNQSEVWLGVGCFVWAHKAPRLGKS
jgi:hypothetical protein